MLLLLGCASVIHAQSSSWAENMFEIKSHNFGSVPLKSDAQYHFVFHNRTGSDVRIVSVSSSCSCTEASYTKKVVKNGEKGAIVAKVNTSGQHIKKRSSTLRVEFDQPNFAIVQLEVAVYIRPDIVLDPGNVDFGAVAEGKGGSKRIRLYYAGDPNWGLDRIDRANKNPYVNATATKITQGGSDREIVYDITVTLSEKTPPGYVHEVLRLITNKTSVDSMGRKVAATIELPVSGVVLDPLVAKPSPFQFGTIAPGETVTKYMVLRASQPFRIRDISCPKDGRFKFIPADQRRSIHVVAVSFTAQEDKAEDISETILVHTDLKDQSVLRIGVHARVLSEDKANFQEFYAPQWKEKLMQISSKSQSKNRVLRPKPLRIATSDEGKNVERKTDSSVVPRRTEKGLENPGEGEKAEPNERNLLEIDLDRWSAEQQRSRLSEQDDLMERDSYPSAVPGKEGIGENGTLSRRVSGEDPERQNSGWKSVGKSFSEKGSLRGAENGEYVEREGWKTRAERLESDSSFGTVVRSRENPNSSRSEQIANGSVGENPGLKKTGQVRFGKPQIAISERERITRSHDHGRTPVPEREKRPLEKERNDAEEENSFFLNQVQMNEKEEPQKVRKNEEIIGVSAVNMKSRRNHSTSTTAPKNPTSTGNVVGGKYVDGKTGQKMELPPQRIANLKGLSRL